MAYKIDNIQNIPNPKTQSPSEFEQKTTNFLNSDLPTFINQANELSDDLTNKWNETHTFRNDAESFKNSTYSYMNTALSYKNNAENAKNLAYGYKVDAQSAANRAEAVVIPTEATYALADMNAYLDEILRVQTAQQVAISVLQS